MDTGVERIVDQVVNPKLNSNFVPKIEDIVYKYLGIEKPTNRMTELEINTDGHQQEQFLPNLDLEQVSPESEKCPSIESHSPLGHDFKIHGYGMNDTVDDKMDDLESPAFEPIVCKKEENVEEDDDKMDICMGDSDDEQNKSNGFNVNSCDDVKSNLSSISGLTSNESIEDTAESAVPNQVTVANIQESAEAANIELVVDDEPPPEASPPTANVQQFDAIEQPEEKPSIHYTNDVVENINQDSVLSQVSSNSRLSIITNNNTNTRIDDADDDGDGSNGPLASADNGDKVDKDSPCPYGISEEAQMQRFNESSSSNNSLVIDTDHVTHGASHSEKKEEFVTAFDINKEEIKFEGTERKSFDIDLSEPKVTIDESPTGNGNEIEPDALVKEEEAKTPETVVASSAETSKDANSKSGEDVSSVSLTDANDVSVKVASPIIENASNDAKARTDDSKSLDESSSTSSKHKEGKSSSSTSSSYHRNGVESESKSRPKERHSSSSTSSRRHGHSDHSKRSHSSSHSSASKEKSRSSRDEKHRESSKHRSDDRFSKSAHHKSSSSSSANKDKERSRSSRKDSHRHTSSSQSSSTSRRDKDAPSKNSSKDVDHKKPRSDSHRSGSYRDKDDHALHKEKPITRQRSKSKDSNDGSASSSNGLRQITESTNETNANQTETTTAQSGSGVDQQSSSEQQTMSSHSSPQITNEHPECSSTSPIAKAPIADRQPIGVVADDDFMLATQPVVVDQILSGTELNLDAFIDENRDNPLISSIERTLADHAKVKKPKMAANIHEARKLMKVRKKIDREEQKKLEQARVLAKQYMRSNLTTRVDESQGVELEFACMIGGSTTAPGPSISSPVKFNSGKEMSIDEKPPTPPMKVVDTVEEMDILDETDVGPFEGFSTEDYDIAKELLRQFDAIVKCKRPIQAKDRSQSKKPTNRSTQLIPSDQLIEMMSSNEDNRQLFLENNKIPESESPASTKSLNIRKRKYTEASVSSNEAIVEDGEVASVVANVLITPKNEPSSGRSGTVFILRCPRASLLTQNISLQMRQH